MRSPYLLKRQFLLKWFDSFKRTPSLNLRNPDLKYLLAWLKYLYFELNVLPAGVDVLVLESMRV